MAHQKSASNWLRRSVESASLSGFVWFVSGLLLVTMIVLSPSLWATWKSDDYVTVYGVYGNSIKTFTDALAHATSGLITAHRIFLFWFLGIGGILGPIVAHALAVGLHALCVVLFCGLIWRLFHSFLLSVIATSWFALAPWIGEPELWWSAVCTTVSSILMLIAAHSFISSLVTKGAHSIAWSITSFVTIFLALCFYDLWIPGLFVFWGIWILRAIEIKALNDR